MCTVSFIARKDGYLLGMNRDEKLRRPAGLPPQRHHVRDRKVIYPSEPGGGTWISLNDGGSTLALINWYSAPHQTIADPISRGEIIRTACDATAPHEVVATLASMLLARTRPFRLIGIFPASHEVIEWRWNGLKLEGVKHLWRPNIWISSGYDEPGADQTRSKAFGAALLKVDRGTVEWLRSLHRSHSHGESAYSICMHRDDAATVSYTEIEVSDSVRRMHYSANNPCTGKRSFLMRSCRSSYPKLLSGAAEATKGSSWD
jgi:hypothetical protein